MFGRNAASFAIDCVARLKIHMESAPAPFPNPPPSVSSEVTFEMK